MHSRGLHDALRAWMAGAADALAEARAGGAELEFELADAAATPGRATLWCYRPLTGAFIVSQWERLTELASHAPALQALQAVNDLAPYLDYCGVAPESEERVGQADSVMRTLISRVFAERTDFTLDESRLACALSELERSLYAGRRETTVLARVHGLGLDPAMPALDLGDGLSLVRGETLSDAPRAAVWGDAGFGSAHEPGVLAVLSVRSDDSERAPVVQARTRFRRILTALRLFERGGYSLGPVGFVRTGAGAWREAAIGSGGRPGLITLIGAAQAQELMAFHALLGRRPLGGGDAGVLPPAARSGAGELAWALARFEMGCERLSASEALSDHLLALRALLEPEGPRSGRLPQRLAVLCAPSEQRRRLAERAAAAAAAERAVIEGRAAPDTGVEGLAREMSEHLRALLRDVVCGHLDADLCALADELLAEEVTAAA